MEIFFCMFSSVTCHNNNHTLITGSVIVEIVLVCTGTVFVVAAVDMDDDFLDTLGEFVEDRRDTLGEFLRKKSRF